jgi:membrane protease YdiL (CAAX protease family)
VRNNSTSAPSPLLPTNWPREAWHPLVTVAALIGAIGIMFFAVIAYFVILLIVDPAGAKALTDPSQLLVVQIVAYLPTAAYLLIVLPPLSRTSLADLGFRAPTGRDMLFALGGVVVMVIVVNVSATLIAALTHRQDTEQAVALLRDMKTPLEKFGFFALACVFAPLCEELFFRVFVYNALTRYVNVPIAIVGSGILFGLLHASGWQQILTVGVPLSLGGMTLAYVYARTKCFWANVTTHALFNSISVVAFFVFHVS